VVTTFCTYSSGPGTIDPPVSVVALNHVHSCGLSALGGGVDLENHF
jgi:hypothetical protein